MGKRDVVSALVNYRGICANTNFETARLGKSFSLHRLHAHHDASFRFLAWLSGSGFGEHLVNLSLV